MPGLGIRPRPAVTVAAAPALGGMSMADQLRAEHEWWVRRNAAAERRAARGELDEGHAYAVAAREAQRRLARATWWAAATYTVFAWLAVVRGASFDWGGSIISANAPSGSALLAPGLILLVGLTAAGALSAWMGGAEAWRSTAVSAPLWLLGTLVVGVLVVSGGVMAMSTLTAVALGGAALMIVLPLRA